MIAHVGPLPIEELLPTLMTTIGWLLLQLRRRS
jgi:hypothetical protein